MTTRSWWLGVAIVTLAILVHAAIPRYAWRNVPEKPLMLVRVDRWTGRAEWGTLTSSGAWTPAPQHP